MMDTPLENRPDLRVNFEKALALSHHFPIILYDGVCHLCHRSVAWIIKKDTQSRFKYLPLQWVTGMKEINSVIVISKGRTYTKSAATIQVLKLLNGRYKYMAAMIQLIPAVLSDAVYDIVASSRYSWFGRYSTCEMIDDSYYEWWKDTSKIGMPNSNKSNH